MSVFKFSFLILTMYLPGIGEPAGGTIIGAGRARATGRSERGSESFIMADG